MKIIEKRADMNKLMDEYPDSLIVAINTDWTQNGLFGDLLAIVSDEEEFVAAGFDKKVSVFYGVNHYNSEDRLGGYRCC